MLCVFQLMCLLLLTFAIKWLSTVVHVFSLQSAPVAFGISSCIFLLFFFLSNTTPVNAKGYPFKNSKPAMHFSRITNYAVRLSVTQVGSATGAQAGDKIVLPSALLLALFGLGLSTFSVKQLLSTPRSRF